MSETQLREAFTLMKQGDKVGAARMVEAVLREDRSNSNAWWLYSHLLQDEEKVVKSLERVLALSPEHAGARKRLAQMRPEYAHLAPNPEAEKEKAKAAKADTAYWNRVDKNRQLTQKPGCLAILLDGLLGIYRTLGPKNTIATIAVIFIMAGAILGSQIDQETLPDSLGQTPQTVAARYYEAMYAEDAATLYEVTCPARDYQVDEMVAEFVGFSPEEVSVDLTETRFVLSNRREEKAYIAIHGIMTVDAGGTIFTLDWDLDAEAEGYDGYGLFFERIDGVWLVCEPYYIPDMEYHED